MIKKTGLLLALVMTAAFAPPSYAAPYSGYPFLYEDFEDGKTDCVSWDNVASYGISDSGYAKSKGSLKVTLGGNGQIMHIPVSLNAGTKYRLSCYVKPEGDVQTDELDFIFWLKQKLADGSAGKEGYRRIAVKNLSFNDGEWTKVSADFNFDGTAALNGNDVEVLGDGKLSLRFGSNGSLSEINGKSSFTYYVDDLCVEPIFEPSTVPDKEAFDNGGLIRSGSFEGKSVSDAWEQDGVTAEIISGGADGTPQAVSVSGSGKFKQKVPIAYSHTFGVNGYIKAAGDDVGNEARLVVDASANGGSIESYPIGTLTEDWQQFNVSVYRKPEADYNDEQPYLYIETDGGYCLDEISLTSEKAIVHNGDFSEELEEYWIANDSADAVSRAQEVPGGECAAENSLLVSQSNARRDWAYQFISVKPETEYKLSFWAKGVGCKNGNDITNYAVMPVFQNVTSETRFDTKDDSLSFETEWKHYEITYTTPADIESSVRFYIRSSNNFVATEFYVTDIRLSEANDSGSDDGGEITYTTPEIRNLEADGYLIKNNEISVNAEYLGPNAQTGLMQLFKQAADGSGWASIKTCEFNGEPLTYTFSDSDIGQNVKVRIVPMDVEGNVGGYREKELGRVFDSFEITAEFISTPQDENITAQATVANWSGSDKSVVCMLLLYDESNACIASAYDTVSTTFGSRETISVSLPDSAQCKSARLFVWEGTSDVDTTMISLKRSVLYEKQ